MAAINPTLCRALHLYSNRSTLWYLKHMPVIWLSHTEIPHIPASLFLPQHTWYFVDNKHPRSCISQKLTSWYKFCSKLQAQNATLHLKECYLTLNKSAGRRNQDCANLLIEWFSSPLGKVNYKFTWGKRVKREDQWANGAIMITSNEIGGQFWSEIIKLCKICIFITRSFGGFFVTTLIREVL